MAFFKPFILAASLAAALAAIAQPATAAGGDAVTFETVLGAPKPFEDYPKPWPLQHLVTPGKLTIGTTGASPPRTFVDPATGELTGSYVDLFKKIAADLGLQPEFVKLEWSGILPGLAANRFDIACDGGSWTKERLGSQQFLMTSPTSINATVALARADGGISTFADAKGHPIGGVRGEVYFEDAKKALPGSPQTEFPGLPESLLGLQNGQVDLVAMNLSSAMDVLHSAANKDQFKLVGPALQVFAQSLCVNPREPDLLVGVNTLLGNYRTDGSLKALVVKYGSLPAEVELLGRIGY
jgi:ABC-type amino acid transport substrate-binding protein